MAIPLSQFVRSDENIVKQPKVALVNSTDTMPPKTRPLDVTPPIPPPTNIGEIGSYPFVSGDPTPIGDEKFDSDNPPNFAVEYIVFVTDEGSGINVSSEEGFETIDGWSTLNASTTGLGLTTRDPQQGTSSLIFNKASGTTTVGVEKSFNRDYSKFSGTSYFFDLYLPSVTGVAAARLAFEDGAARVHEWETTASLSAGWNTITFPVDTPNITADAGFDITDLRKVLFKVRFTSSGATLAGIELDDFKGTDIRAGKIETGDVKVGFARNSAHQTRFEFNGPLNRWALLDEDLGEITNGTPRLQIPTKFVNDFSERSVDFILTVDGTPMTVVSVATEAGFTSPPAGTVEFALDTQAFNFSAADLVTFDGKLVTYQEIRDGEVTVNSAGVASLERSIDMTFFQNPTLSKKDLTLNLTLVDEIISNELSATKEIRISFVPNTGTTSLRYDPVPNGAPDPLVEGTDFVIDVDVPSIKFTKASTAEVILSDFDTNPQNPGDPDSGQGKFNFLPMDFTDVVANSVTLTLSGSGVQTEDEDFLVDLTAGIVQLTQGLVEESLMDNVFIPDTSFIDANFTFKINGVELLEFTLVPEIGWINIDRSLLPGDVPTASYTSTDIEIGTVTDEFMRSPGVDLQTGTLITASAPATGGEFSFTVQNPPIQVARFEVAAGTTTIELEGDRTTDYVSDALIQMNSDYYQIVSAVYDGGSDITTVTIAVEARQAYTNPITFFSKSAPTWTVDATAHDAIPEGVSTFTLTGAADSLPLFFTGIFIRLNTDDIYAVAGSKVVGADLEVQLTTNLTQNIGAAQTFERTTTPIPRVGDTEFQSFFTPVLDIPTRFDSGGDPIDLNDRFPGLGGDVVRVIRNGSDLTRDLDYEVTFEGVIRLLRTTLVAGDDTLVLRYVPLRDSDLGDELLVDYVYFAESESGVGLRVSLEYELPDTFYFRVVNNNTQALAFQSILEDFVKQKTGQVSSGSSPTIPTASGNHQSGLNTPITDIGDKYDNDLVAQRIYEFYNVRIGYVEAEKQELSGEVVGGFTGPLTDQDVEDNALGAGRAFPVDSDITFAVEDKDSDELIIPARPYRVPAIFGMAVEDDIKRVVRDKEYPLIPIVTFPAFPPQGQRYKGSNQDPALFAVTLVFGLGSSASAATTFIENWYPLFLDRTYSNPFTSNDYTDYTVSPAGYDSTVLDVEQDTGDPSTSVPVFPPASKELDPDDFAGFEISTFPLPIFISAAPRPHGEVSPNYEAAALGALQSIDSAIEATTLAGIPHRETVGDPTSYTSFVYRDQNEFDLLTNGTVSADTELARVQAQWAIDEGGRSTPAGYVDNVEQQILCLNIQVESLQKQMDALDLLLAQIVPVPVANPEVTTFTEATSARAAAATAQTDAVAARTDAQDYLDVTLVGGSWTDADLLARWLFLTGVDGSAETSGPSGTPLPLTPVTAASRVLQVSARIAAIVDRLVEVNTTLGFDNTQEPAGFTVIATSENLYTTRYTWLDLRLNRESGTLFNALQAHDQYVRGLTESESLLDIISVLSG